MKSTILALVKSIATTTIISALIGAVAFYAGHSFLLWFVVAFATQFTVFYLFNTFLQYKAARDSRALMLAEAEVTARNTMTVECASCKKTSEVVVFTNRENRFICGHCKTKNSVYLLAETAVVTEPLYESEPIPNTTSTNAS